MVHCGYEPTATLGLQAQPGDTWKTIKFNFGVKPKPAGGGSEVLAFNGVSSGNGHITGKRSEEHTSELQSQSNLVCRLLLEKKNQNAEIDANPGWPPYRHAEQD